MASAGLYASLHLIPDNHANIPPLSFLQTGCPSCHPTNSLFSINYFGGMLSVVGGAGVGAAVEAVVRIGWSGFVQLVPLFTGRVV